MNISEIPKSIGYAVVFGLIGVIIGLWTADLLYGLILKNIERVTTIYISLVIVLLIAVAAFSLGFIKGKYLLEQ